MFITGLGTAVPQRRYTQKECWDLAKASEQIRRLAPHSQAVIRKVLLGDNGIESRYLALDSLAEIFEMEPDALHRRFSRHAPALAAEAAVRALANSGTAPGEVDALLVSTCTGYLCPGLTSYVSERLSLRTDTLLLDLVGQGCGAALPSLRTADALLASGRARKVLSVCVEVCSAAFYLDDDPGVLVSACLFGDGAAAAVLSTEPSDRSRRTEWVGARTVLSPKQRDCLRFEQRDGMLRNILSKDVPELAGQYVDQVLCEMLATAGLSREGVTTWILHAGGRNILVALAQRLQLTDQDLRWSEAVLRVHGNLSSPCVLFVLESALRYGAPGGKWWMSSFGAGFSCHGALLEVA
jgi:alkylresorcinol/alkylpyrone synthase